MEEPIEDDVVNIDEYTMYIFVNNDLAMGKGKIAGQVAHATQIVTAALLRLGFDYIIKEHLHKVLSSSNNEDSPEQTNPAPDAYERFLEWEGSQQKKIILKATQKEMEELQKLPESISVYDAGRTQVQPNSLTVVAFYPSATQGENFKKYKLL